MSSAHAIEAVRYVRGVPSADAPLECRCGWVGPASDHPGHRKEVMDPNGNGPRVGVPPTPPAWRNYPTGPALTVKRPRRPRAAPGMEDDLAVPELIEAEALGALASLAGVDRLPEAPKESS